LSPVVFFLDHPV